jgi:hypothetical protein
MRSVSRNFYIWTFGSLRSCQFHQTRLPACSIPVLLGASSSCKGAKEVAANVLVPPTTESVLFPWENIFGQRVEWPSDFDKECWEDRKKIL